VPASASTSLDNILWLALAAVSYAQDASIIFANKGPSNLGIFWGGDLSINRELNARDWAYEKKVDFLEPGSSNSHDTNFGHAFIVRSADMKIRFKVILDGKSQDKDRPIRLTFTNLAADDMNPEVELKHSDSDYLWIEGTHSVTHDTGTGHTFQIRDNNRVPIFDITLRDPVKAEL